MSESRYPFEKYENISQLPYDVITLIIQLIENYDKKAFEFIINNQFQLKNIKTNVISFDIKPFLRQVIKWDECDCRGRKHIENMKSEIFNGYKFPPVIHNFENSCYGPLDGRHRIIAMSEIGYNYVESISLDDIINQIIKISNEIWIIINFILTLTTKLTIIIKQFRDFSSVG